MPLPFLADDIVWSEVPIIGWLAFAIVIMLIAVARFGWGRARDVLVKYRLFWGGSLVLALISAAVLHVVSGQPLRHYL